MGATAFLKNAFTENLVRRPPGVYARAAGVVLRAESLPLSDLRRLRDELTAKTLRQAEATPYAREAGLFGPFERWPILEKETLQLDARICLAPTLLPTHAASTGGTTGIPIPLRRSLESVVFEQSVLDRLVARESGLHLKNARVAVLRGDPVKSPNDTSPPFWKLRQRGLHLVCSSFHLNAGSIGDFVQAIGQFDPDILWVYPSSLEALVRLGSDALREHPLSTLKLVLASSEVLDATLLAETMETLGVPVLDYYGQGERVSASWSVRAGEHYFLPAYGRTELLHAHDDGADSLYEIVGTSFWNAAQPLVRFRTGDLARLPPGLSPEELEAVTLGLSPFRGVGGRTSEYILAADGKRLFGLNQIARGVPGIAQMQIVQKAVGRMEIHVVPRADFGERSRTVILANAGHKIPSSVAIEIKTVEGVMRTRSGKAPLVMRLLE